MSRRSAKWRKLRKELENQPRTYSLLIELLNRVRYLELPWWRRFFNRHNYIVTRNW